MAAERPRLPKLCGTDVELGNFIVGAGGAGQTGARAARALLRQIDGFPAPNPAGCDGRALADWEGGRLGSGYDSQDWGRKFLSNGSCVYIDLDHLELASAETLSAWDQLGCVHAMLRLARGAMAAANASLPRGQRVQVLVNNSDGSGSSYGSHVNVLLTRAAWNDLFDRRLHHLLYLAAFQASSIVFTGQGKVGSENEAPPVNYQISQRADFLETLVGPQTTCRRPMVNSRDEALCGIKGTRTGKARLHVIFYDSTLCHTATLLKLGTLQIVLAMIEAGRVDPGCILDDPLDAVLRWSHDPTLRASTRLIDGTSLTATELQARFVASARTFVDEGACDDIVPGARELVSLWEWVVDRLLARDLDALVSRIDWVLKMSILERAMTKRRNLDWSSAQVKHLDHLYSSLDLEDGLYWAHERAGLVEQLVTDDRVRWLTSRPPETTRAWTRGTLLECAGAAGVEDASWDWVRVWVPGRGGWSVPRTICLDDPLGWTKDRAEDAFSDASDVRAIADRLGALSESQSVNEREAGYGRA
jgi:Pup amidohydrolase